MKTPVQNYSTPLRPRIVGLSHVGLFVRDLEKAVSFYQDFLGFDEQFELKKDDGATLLKFMKVNDRQCIELFPEPDPSTDRLYQIAFIVEDAEAMRLHLQSHGVEVPQSARKGRIGNMAFTAKDPDGHILEFVQYLPGGWTLDDTGKHLGTKRMSGRLKHIGFTVRSLEPSLAFYKDILGCSITWKGSSDKQKLSWVNVKLPDSDEYLELMLYDKELSWESKGVLNHFSFEVDDVTTASEELKLRVADGLYDRPIETRTGINLKRQLNLYDPDGTRSELMEGVTVTGMSPEWFEPET